MSIVEVEVSQPYIVPYVRQKLTVFGVNVKVNFYLTWAISLAPQKVNISYFVNHRN